MRFVWISSVETVFVKETPIFNQKNQKTFEPHWYILWCSLTYIAVHCSGCSCYKNCKQQNDGSKSRPVDLRIRNSADNCPAVPPSIPDYSIPIPVTTHKGIFFKVKNSVLVLDWILFYVGVHFRNMLCDCSEEPSSLVYNWYFQNFFLIKSSDQCKVNFQNT